MRIGIDATSLLCAEPRGEGKSLLRLYQEIARLRPDFNFVLFGSRRAGQGRGVPDLPRAEVVLFDSPGHRWNLWENLALPWQAWHHRCDILHATSSGTPRWAPLPVVMTVHDVIPLIFDDGLTAYAKLQFQKRLYNGVRLAQTVITVSENTRLDLQALFPGRKIPVRVIPWGADHRPEIQYARPVQGDYILAFGGSARRKNTAMTLRAFAQAAMDFPELRLVMLGMGNTPANAALLALADTLGIRKKLILPGFVSEAELPAYYQHALFLCYLSLYEGFGVPLLEAMGQRVPILASNRTSIPEVVGQAALLTDPERIDDIVSAMKKMASDADQREQLKQLAAVRIQQFSWEKCAQSVIDVLMAQKVVQKIELTH